MYNDTMLLGVSAPHNLRLKFEKNDCVCTATDLSLRTSYAFLSLSLSACISLSESKCSADAPIFSFV